MTEPRILLYDVENFPIEAYVWTTYKIDRVIKVKQDWSLASVAWKWLGESKIKCVTTEGAPRDDFGVASQLNALFEEADILVAHNGNEFDQRKARARMWFHGFAPPSPFKEVDTLKVARQQFALSDNRLDALGEYLDVGRKLPTGGFDLWEGCLADDPAAWRRMRRYNKSDVALLERVYLRMRPWMPRHPNVSMLSEKPDSCPRCQAGKDMLQRRGWAVRGVTRVPRFQCQSCGGWSQGRKVDSLRPDVYVG